MCPCISFHLSVVHFKTLKFSSLSLHKFQSALYQGVWVANKCALAFHFKYFVFIQQFMWTILTWHKTLRISQHSNIPFWVSVTFHDSQSALWPISWTVRCQKTHQTLPCISQHSNVSFHFEKSTLVYDLIVSFPCLLNNPNKITCSAKYCLGPILIPTPIFSFSLCESCLPFPLPCYPHTKCTAVQCNVKFIAQCNIQVIAMASTVRWTAQCNIQFFAMASTVQCAIFSPALQCRKWSVFSAGASCLACACASVATSLTSQKIARLFHQQPT